MRNLERENSEMKAAKLMSMFANGTSGPSQLLSSSSSKLGATQTSNLERQVESLKLQLSEKTNDYLRLRDENDSLREQC